MKFLQAVRSKVGTREYYLLISGSASKDRLSFHSRVFADLKSDGAVINFVNTIDEVPLKFGFKTHPYLGLKY